jgi:hypothetical protein
LVNEIAHIVFSEKVLGRAYDMVLSSMVYFCASRDPNVLALSREPTGRHAPSHTT